MNPFAKTMKTCCALGLSLVAGVAFADGIWGVQDSFEGTLPVALPAHWSGNAVITNAEAVGTLAFGYPIPGAAHVNTLQIEGKAVCTNTSAVVESSTASQVDFLVKVVAPDEAPDVATEASGAQIALAAWTNEVATAPDTVPLKLWCKGRDAEEAAWYTLTNAVTTGTWVRISMNFDYANGVCQVSMNGSPLVTQYGYRTNEKNANDANDANGSWYALANAPAAGIGNRVSEVKVVGTTYLDDLVITNASLAAYNPYVDAEGNEVTTTITPASGNAVTVPLSVVAKSGLTTGEIAAGGSAPGDTLSVLAVVEAGLEIGKGQTFEMKTITPSAPTTANEKTTQTFTLTFPGMNDNDYYSVQVFDNAEGTGTALSVSDGAVSGGKGNSKTWTGTVDVTGKKTIYFKLKAQQPQN